MAQENQVNEAGTNDHEKPAENKHEHKVSRTSPKRSLLEHWAMPVEENEVKNEWKSDGAKVAKGSEQPPQLQLFVDQL